MPDGLQEEEMKRLFVVTISLGLTFGLMPASQAAAKVFKNWVILGMQGE
jgi:uncharacterized membrane protein YesL